MLTCFEKQLVTNLYYLKKEKLSLWKRILILNTDKIKTDI